MQEIQTMRTRRAGGSRRMAVRWVLKGTLTLCTAAHLGAGTEGDSVDMPVLRDAAGEPLLPGTSIAGALRSHLLDTLDGFGRPEQAGRGGTAEQEATEQRPEKLALVAALFGGAKGDDDGAQSALIVHDAYATLPASGIELRDGVAIDPAWGTARDSFKYDMEVLPPGTRFGLELELIVADADREAGLLDALVAALDGFNTRVAIGARRSRGLGRCQAGGWETARWALADAAGWRAWLEDRRPKARPADSLAEAVRGAWPDWQHNRIHDVAAAELWTAEVELQLRRQQGILIRSAGTRADDPDVTHLLSGGLPVLTGTGLAGVLRARALRVARLVLGTPDAAAALVDEVFGPQLSGSVPKAARASRLRVGEAAIAGGEPGLVSRTRLDRFTGGVVEGALFDEAPHLGGKIKLELSLRPAPDRDGGDRQIGLWLLLLRDLIRGDLPVGGTSAVGRGFLKGTATIRGQGATCDLQQGAAGLQRYVDALRRGGEEG